MSIKLEDLQCLRKKQGVYFLYDKNKELVYIGESGNVYVRLLEHIIQDEKEISYFKCVSLKNQTFMQVLEVKFINRFTPKYNKLVVNDINKWFNTIPKICKQEMAKDDCIDLYKTNKLSELSDIIYDKVNRIEFNSVFNPLDDLPF